MLPISSTNMPAVRLRKVDVRMQRAKLGHCILECNCFVWSLHEHFECRIILGLANTFYFNHHNPTS